MTRDSETEGEENERSLRVVLRLLLRSRVYYGPRGMPPDRLNPR